MTKISKVLIGLAIAMVASFASAANYYDSEDSCVAAGRAGKAVDYKPTGKSKGYGDARVAGLEKRPLEGDACVLLAAQPGKRWVFLKKGTIVYTNGAEIKMLGECQNDIFEAHFIKTAQEPAAGCTTNCAVTVVKEVLEITNVTRKCVVDGKEIAMVDGECKPNPIKVTLNTKVETNISSSCGSTCNTPAATQPAKTAQGCTENCTPQEKPTVTRQEARTDGRCMIQTNMGYRFELRANTTTGRLMVSMVDPQTEIKIEGTKAQYVGNGAIVLASKNAQGFDCDGMQAQLYQNWEAVRSSYELPSACKLTGKAAAPVRKNT